MHSVRRLVMSMHVGEERARGTRQVAKWCMPFLAQMTQLESLELSACRILSLPVLPRLKHLELALEVPLAAAAVACIAALSALETLHLITPRGGKLHIGGLSLGGNSRLQAVAFANFMPHNFQLPPAAKLTVTVDAAQLLQHQHTLLGRHQGLHLCGNPGDQITCLEHLLGLGSSLFDGPLLGMLLPRL